MLTKVYILSFTFDVHLPPSSSISFSNNGGSHLLTQRHIATDLTLATTLLTGTNTLLSQTVDTFVQQGGFELSNKTKQNTLLGQ